MRIYKTLAIVIVSISLLAACGTMGIRVGARMDTAAGSEDARSLPSMSNNTQIELEAGTYQASEITHNSVVLSGAGTGRTAIVGTLRISGNNARVRGLTIEGNVTITGNNTDLRDARITGSVDDQGQNNSW